MSSLDRLIEIEAERYGVTADDIDWLITQIRGLRRTIALTEESEVVARLRRLKAEDESKLVKLGVESHYQTRLNTCLLAELNRLHGSGIVIDWAAAVPDAEVG